MLIETPVAVCIATRGRAAQLRRLLTALVEQEIPPAHIIVVDNSERPDREVAEAVEATAGARATLEHEPRPGIPHARNRGVAVALETDVPFLAFIDDDEVPVGGWPGPLVDEARELDADVVVGPVEGTFPPDTPEMYRRSGIFDQRRRSPDGRLETAPTHNTVVHRRVFEEVRPWFDPSLAGVGGSDSEFFTRAAAAGARIYESERGLVVEHVPPSRTRVRWIAKRALRIGSLEETVGPQRAHTPSDALARLLRATGSVLKGVGTIVGGLIAADPGRALRGLWRASWGMGRISGVLGHPIAEYTAANGGDVRVLAYPGPGQTDNPYIDLLYRSLEQEGLSIDPYHTRRALRGSYDLLHVHWPEAALHRARNRPHVLNALQFVLTVTWLELRRTRIVWTLHNLQPHERGSLLADLLLRWFSRRVDGWLTLSEHAHDLAARAWPALTDAPSTVVAHGHYRDRYGSTPSRSEARRRLGLDEDVPVLLFFGRIRPYKGVEDLVSAFSEVERRINLIIAGRPEDQAVQDRIRWSAAGDERIRLILEFIDEERVPTLFSAADLVVLPFRDITHSGSVMLALSLGRPVLVPDTPVMRESQEAVGEAWLATYEGSLGPDDLTRALEFVRQENPRSPDLDWADWSVIGRATARFFRQVAR